jgi:Ca2+-binding EF-hand superfamily protein
MVNEIGNNNLSQVWLNSLFSKVDSNGDGKISESEFKDFSEIMANKLLGGNGSSSDFDLSKLFSKIDTDQDGSISKDEFNQFIKDQKKMPPPAMSSGLNLLGLTSDNANDMVSKIDTDGDGVISKDEFVKYIKKQEEAFQTNMQTMFAGASADNDSVASAANTDTSVSGDEAVGLV